METFFVAPAKSKPWLGMVVHTCTPTLGRPRQEDHEFKSSQKYLQTEPNENKEKQ